MLRRQTQKLARRLFRIAKSFQTLNRIEISRSRVLHNVKLLQNRHPGIEIIPVLKANAYGHGLQQMADILSETSCKYIAVDGYFEAAAMRYTSNRHMIVLGYILPKNVKLLDFKRCSFVVQDIAGLNAFGALKKKVRIHLELNTGMNRMGLQPYEEGKYLDVLKKYPKLKLEGIMTHLADADNELDESFTKAQVEKFDGQVAHILAKGFKPKLIHIAQTAGSTKATSRYANAIRLGIGLYGINPLKPPDPHYKDLAGLKPVLELKSTIVKTYALKPGDKVSYNGIFTSHKDMRIGVLPLGYYEGVPREFSNSGIVTSGDNELPIVGRVCMNHTMIDLRSTKLAVGSEVTVISNDLAKPNSVSKMEARQGSFAYTQLSGLSSSVRRVIV